MKKTSRRNTEKVINLAELIDDMSEEKLTALHNLIVSRLNTLHRQQTRQNMEYFRPGDVVSFRTEDKMINLTAEQRQLAKTVHDYASRFPLSEVGHAQLLQGCYDYMEAFKRVMDSTSKVQMDYICQQYPSYFRFAKWMERLAKGVADGVIEVPKDH